MLLSNTIWCARTPTVARDLLFGNARAPSDPPIMALTPLTPSFCQTRLAPMRHAMFDFTLVPDADHLPEFVRTLVQALHETCVLESVRPGIIETCLTRNKFKAPETLVAYGPDFDPEVLLMSSGTINLMVLDISDPSIFKKTGLLRLWHRSTLIVPHDRLQTFAEQIAASRV